jgi:hypothetical protein
MWWYLLSSGLLLLLMFPHDAVILSIPFNNNPPQSQHNAAGKGIYPCRFVGIYQSPPGLSWLRLLAARRGVRPAPGGRYPSPHASSLPLV